MYMRKSSDGFSIAMVEYYSVKVLEVETWDCETQKLMGKKWQNENNQVIYYCIEIVEASKQLPDSLYFYMHVRYVIVPLHFFQVLWTFRPHPA